MSTANKTAAFETTAARDARMITLQSRLLDHAGHVNRDVSREQAQKLAAEINSLRAANGFGPLNMRGRYRPVAVTVKER